MKKTIIFIFILNFSFLFLPSAADDFFSIREITFYRRPPTNGIALYRITIQDDKPKESIFLPFLKVSVSTKEQIASKKLFAKIYFFDDKGIFIEEIQSPAKVDRSDGYGNVSMPILFNKDKREFIYFAVPANVLSLNKWHALVVFGDKESATFQLYPKNHYLQKNLSFSERSLVELNKKVERIRDVNQIVEYVIDTGVASQPQITLFLRQPIGAESFSETKGVLALCLLAGSVPEMKKRLQEADVSDDLTSILKFAEKNNLAIICWGASSLWNPRANWDELERKENEKIDKNFNAVAKAWSQGITRLAKQYGLPEKNFLLWGMSGSAQYAARLALRQPEFFLAVYIHIPSSFDKPTIEANSVLWCLTTGEKETGYKRSLKFLEECQKLKYPIIYKAIPNLGHAGHPGAAKIGEEFFDYALTLREAKENYAKTQNSQLRSKKIITHSWQKPFYNPLYQGDIFRQKVYPNTLEKSDIPPAILVSLPTETIANAWLNAK